MPFSSPLPQKLTDILRLAAPQTLLAALLLAGVINLPLPHVEGTVKPFLVLMPVYYWSIYRPTLVPPALCFAVGLALDVLSGAPLGLNAFVLVAVQWLVRDQRRFLMGQPYAALWAVFGALSAAVALTQWGLYGLARLQWPPLLPAALSVLLGVLLFPAVSLALTALHRLLPVASRSYSP